MFTEMVRLLLFIYIFDGNVSLFNHGAEIVMPKCSIVEIQYQLAGLCNYEIPLVNVSLLWYFIYEFGHMC